MNKLIRYLIILTACGGLAASLPAQPAPKILVIDLTKALENYYRAQDSRAKLNDRAQKAQDQLDDLNKQIQALADQYKELVEKTKNTAMFSAEVRNQADADAQKKMQEIQQRRQAGEQFANNTRASLQQSAKNYNDILVDEIKGTATKIARARGATLVLDKGGLSQIGTPTVVYTDAAYDITDDVLTELNKDKPAAAPAAATPAPAATTAPANPAAPPATFSVPNVTPATKKP
jgi:outer membrane protein